jgi:ABC-type branched-subunit amino acid transport system ATPase component
MTVMLQLDDVHAYYGNIHALKGISLHVEQGEIVTLIGSNGAGKSTTLKTICGIVRARGGTVHLADREITWSGCLPSSRGSRSAAPSAPAPSPAASSRCWPSPAP